MAHTLTITVNDSVYETLKPFIEQQTIDTFLSRVITKNAGNSVADLPRKQYPSIASFRGTLNNIDTSDIREESDRVI